MGATVTWQYTKIVDQECTIFQRQKSATKAHPTQPIGCVGNSFGGQTVSWLHRRHHPSRTEQFTSKRTFTRRKNRPSSVLGGRRAGFLDPSQAPRNILQETLTPEVLGPNQMRGRNPAAPPEIRTPGHRYQEPQRARTGGGRKAGRRLTARVQRGGGVDPGTPVPQRRRSGRDLHGGGGGGRRRRGLRSFRLVWVFRWGVW